MAELGGIEVDMDDPGAYEIDIGRFDQMRTRGTTRNSESEDSAYVSSSPGYCLMLIKASASIKSMPMDDIVEIYENGRRYSNQTYFLPNDEAEEIRSSIMHQTYLSALSGYLTFHRVRPDIDRILDIGSGSGDWAIAMAERYPSCEIIATDIWPFQPAGIPPNLMYEIDDARLEWDFLEKFNYIHVRGLAGAFEDWSIIYKQINDVCSDDGVVEITDLSFVRYKVAKPDSALQRYNDVLVEAARLAKMSLSLEHLQEQNIQAAGFRVFRRVSIEIPIGQGQSNPQKESLGKLALVTVLEGLEAQSLRLLTTHLGWTVEQVEDLCDQVKEEIMRAGLEPFMICQIVIAKKIPSLE